MYLYCGMSDILDGLLARILKQESDLGAKLDSIADMAFVFSVLIAIVPAVAIPMWLWICVVIIASIRMAAYLIGYKKYHVFSACHTYANKATGGLLFCAPVFVYWLGITPAGIILCLFAALSSCEELLIAVLSKELNRNRKSLFKQ
ncbi:CDP-alcohol phosphatidyltransferase family protein [Bifidobacterium tibiigranuli]|jgi:CDP-diacylglycerol--glycerol-3-phosphate 3-phosphatidyltransferase|uniref:CDP-alcohol phosphatidyltransferase family protein n=1 Tax=Bifidobacterium tibiigranuli TaxID=2172043 RepID=UPI0023566629|nr:CDP-alcohol phosphatidyltransferase family protein [Bifidobacterium tibiigranuli]